VRHIIRHLLSADRPERLLETLRILAKGRRTKVFAQDGFGGKRKEEAM
jgi:hypothetical protein